MTVRITELCLDAKHAEVSTDRVSLLKFQADQNAEKLEDNQ